MQGELYLPDLSALQLKSVVHLIEAGLLHGKILLHRGLLAEAEKQASEGDTLALEGLEKLVAACNARGVELEYIGRDSDGRRLTILEEARRRKASLLTCDPITAKIASSLGVRVVYELPPPPLPPLPPELPPLLFFLVVVVVWWVVVTPSPVVVVVSVVVVVVSVVVVVVSGVPPMVCIW